MNVLASGFRCPRCDAFVVDAARPIKSFTCPACRTAVVLFGDGQCFHATLAGQDAPIRCAIERRAAPEA